MFPGHDVAQTDPCRGVHCRPAQTLPVIYLEQTRAGEAGLVVRDSASGASLRFLLVVEREAVAARLETETSGKTVLHQRKTLGTPRKRGFHIEMVLGPKVVECLVDGVAALRVARPTTGRSLEVGVVNEPGISSWFDNFQAYRGRLLWP